LALGAATSEPTAPPQARLSQDLEFIPAHFDQFDPNADLRPRLTPESYSSLSAGRKHLMHLRFGGVPESALRRIGEELAVSSVLGWRVCSARAAPVSPAGRLSSPQRRPVDACIGISA
jgi:hypothetical protein